MNSEKQTDNDLAKTTTKSSKKKHNWMRGFSLGKKATEADIVRAEAIMSIRSFQNKRVYR